MPAAPLTLRDDLGRTVTLAGGPARRVVSLAPSVAENLFAIGAGARLVGVSTVDNYPAAVRKLPKVGDFTQPSVERIRALRPELVVVESATIVRSAADNLEARLKTPVFAQKSDSFDDVIRQLRVLSRLTGVPLTTGRANPVTVMNAKAARVARHIAGKLRVTVFIEVNASPLYAAGPGSFIDDLIRRAGGINVVKGTSAFPLYSKEALLKADPAHYIVAAGGDMGRADAKPTLPPPFNRLSAARTGNVHRLPVDLLFRPTPRLADGLVLLARALHPEG